MIYRKLEAHDYPTYEVLRSFALDFAPTAFGSTNSEEKAYRKERFLARVNNSKSFLLGAFDQEELVGIIGFIAFERIKTRHKGDFFSMIVNPEYHRKGIGSELVRIALEKAFSYEYIRQINLSVEANNQAAIGLYQKMGFVEWGREKNGLTD